MRQLIPASPREVREWVRRLWNQWFEERYPPTPPESDWGDMDDIPVAPDNEIVEIVQDVKKFTYVLLSTFSYLYLYIVILSIYSLIYMFLFRHYYILFNYITILYLRCFNKLINQSIFMFKNSFSLKTTSFLMISMLSIVFVFVTL